jgi:hypothetical protein
MAAAVLLIAGCDDEHRLRIENRTNQTLFVFGTHGGMNLTTGWEFIDPGAATDAELGGDEPDAVHFYFDHPRNADGTPGRLPFDVRLRTFSCTWDQAASAQPLIVTDGDPPCGVVNVSPP